MVNMLTYTNFKTWLSFTNYRHLVTNMTILLTEFPPKEVKVITRVLHQ